MTLHWNYFEVYGHRPWRVYVEINTAHACAATSVIFMKIWITTQFFLFTCIQSWVIFPAKGGNLDYVTFVNYYFCVLIT